MFDPVKEPERDWLEELRAVADPCLSPLIDALANGTDEALDAAWRNLVNEALREA